MGRDSSVTSPSVATASCSSVSKLTASGSRSCSSSSSRTSRSAPSPSPPSGGSSVQMFSCSSAQTSSGSSCGSWPRKKPLVVGPVSSEPPPSPASADGHFRCASISDVRGQSSAPDMPGSVPGSFAPKATDRATSATDRATPGFPPQALARRFGHARSRRPSTRPWSSSAVRSIAKVCPDLTATSATERTRRQVGRLALGASGTSARPPVSTGDAPPRGRVEGTSRTTSSSSSGPSRGTSRRTASWCAATSTTPDARPPPSPAWASPTTRPRRRSCARFGFLHRFRPGAPFRPWLLTVVANVARNQSRSTHRWTRARRRRASEGSQRRTRPRPRTWRSPAGATAVRARSNTPPSLPRRRRLSVSPRPQRGRDRGGPRHRRGTVKSPCPHGRSTGSNANSTPRCTMPESNPRLLVEAELRVRSRASSMPPSNRSTSRAP